MRRYWIESRYQKEEGFELRDETFHHICNVCRRSLNDRFELIVQGKAYLVEIVELENKSAFAKIIESREIPPPPPPEIHLAISLPKLQTFEKVLEKMVELGVTAIHPFTSDFSFVKSASKIPSKKFQRWEKIILGASQQTGRGELLKLTEIKPLGVLLKEEFMTSGGLGLLAYEGEGEKSFKKHLQSHHSGLAPIWIFVGSEGGFSSKDLNLFKDYKLLPISLGDQVLRVETACVTIVSILKYGLGHFD